MVYEQIFRSNDTIYQPGANAELVKNLTPIEFIEIS
jgi:hypothetical protein